MSIIVVHKLSEMEYCRYRGISLDDYILRRGVSKGELMTEHAEHNSTMEIVLGLLDWMGIDYLKIHRGEIASDISAYKSKLSSADLLIAIGGDGTLLDASHYIKDIPVWGINSHSVGNGCSIGWFCSATRFDIGNKVEDVISGIYDAVYLNRFNLILDNKPIEEYVLNDVLVCGSKPASQARYTVSAEGYSESQRSSGLWISTAAGSTGAAYHCGGPSLPSRCWSWATNWDFTCWPGARLRPVSPMTSRL